MRTRRSKRFLKKGKKKEEMVLQITSMADIFTIILVFLLKSFSTGITNITPNGITLPEATSSDEIQEMLKVEIGPSAILVDDKAVTKLLQFEITETDTESDGTPRSLNVALSEKKESDDPAAQPGADEGGAPKLMILADQQTPYGTLKAVMMAASNLGYGDFKLAVVEDK